jgi:hypothetical protein
LLGSTEPYYRIVVEVEIGNRNASQFREVGHAVLDNDYGALFVGIKIWKKSKKDTFGAAIVVWENDRTPGTGQGIMVCNAVDFGTQELSVPTKNTWNKTFPLTSHLPPVLPNARHRPMPLNNGLIHQLIDRRLAGTPVPQIDPGWGLTLSLDRILYRTVDPNGPPGPYILEAVPPFHIPDMTIDLRRYQRILYDSLRR